MSLSKRLILTLSVALLALIVVGGIGLWRLNQAQQRFEYVQANILPASENWTTPSTTLAVSAG
jgi:CHASE3 domain sensor protein